jgi:hypothetical protein
MINTSYEDYIRKAIARDPGYAWSETELKRLGVYYLTAMPDDTVVKSLALKLAKANGDTDMSETNYGFTFSDGGDIPELQAHQAKANQILTVIHDFLDGLAQEPQKRYLLWPERGAKIAELKARLNSILGSHG